MNNRDLAEKIYSHLNEKGAGLGNVSIGLIESVLDKQLAEHIVGQSSPVYTQSIKELTDNYVKWMGANFESADRKDLYKAGLRDGVKWLQWLIGGQKFTG